MLTENTIPTSDKVATNSWKHATTHLPVLKIPPNYFLLLVRGLWPGFRCESFLLLYPNEITLIMLFENLD